MAGYPIYSWNLFHSLAMNAHPFVIGPFIWWWHCCFSVRLAVDNWSELSGMPTIFALMQMQQHIFVFSSDGIDSTVCSHVTCADVNARQPERVFVCLSVCNEANCLCVRFIKRLLGRGIFEKCERMSKYSFWRLYSDVYHIIARAWACVCVRVCARCLCVYTLFVFGLFNFHIEWASNVSELDGHFGNIYARPNSIEKT